MIAIVIEDAVAVGQKSTDYFSTPNLGLVVWGLVKCVGR